MEVLTMLGKWAAEQGASWLLRNRWKLVALVGFLGVAAFVVGAGITASVSGVGSDQEVRAACRTLGYDVASAAGGAEGGYVPAPLTDVAVIPEGGLVDGFGPGETEQIAVAQAIVAAGTAAGVGTRGMVVAIATALQESGLRELGYGDRDSVGPFQQRPSQGWGTPDEVRRADFSARAFFGGPGSPHFDPASGRAGPGGLLEVSGWEQMPVTVAAQKVQRSAFPNAYARHEARAARIVAALTGGTPIPTLPAVDASGSGDATDVSAVVTAEEFRASGFDIDSYCAANGGASGAAFADWSTIPQGTWTAPLASPISSEFGMRLHPVTGIWKLHAGTDFQAATGTPLRAASNGVVSKVTWHATGGLMVVIDHAGGVQTWYLHLSQALVAPGDSVEGGQVVALSGDTGVGTGPHFHFETHVGGVPVDPIAFMAQQGVALRGVAS
ncbi:M23 family metallopeptidase [uncultured Cellulomonas sp.]|uniref:M23 family metallopeptidase n=1 Tax=uncultured Cellulomonas sp. TaxID=189682 RepID=UPI00262BAEC3|nr:M23 family metallopeptidase [uncultured Cellulomonas sp.]